MREAQRINQQKIAVDCRNGTGEGAREEANEVGIMKVIIRFMKLYKCALFQMMN